MATVFETGSEADQISGNPDYGPMIDHRSAEYKIVKVEGDFAQVDVILESKDGQFLGYRFTLSRQHGNQFEGSWMTSAVSLFNVLSLVGTALSG